MHISSLPVLLAGLSVAAQDAPSTAGSTGIARAEVVRAAQGAAERWRDHILPTEAETAWERIPWIPSFAGGILASDERSQPLLLWVMNGHPLGCT